MLHRSQTPANETVSGKKGIKDTYRATSSCLNKISCNHFSNKIESWIIYLISWKKVSYITNIYVNKMKRMLAHKCLLSVVLILSHLILSKHPEEDCYYPSFTDEENGSWVSLKCSHLLPPPTPPLLSGITRLSKIILYFP